MYLPGGVSVDANVWLYTRHDILPILEQHLTDSIMPEVDRTDGVSALVRIAMLAEACHGSPT